MHIQSLAPHVKINCQSLHGALQFCYPTSPTVYSTIPVLFHILFINSENLILSSLPLNRFLVVRVYLNNIYKNTTYMYRFMTEIMHTSMGSWHNCVLALTAMWVDHTGLFNLGLVSFQSDWRQRSRTTPGQQLPKGGHLYTAFVSTYVRTLATRVLQSDWSIKVPGYKFMNK